MFFPEDLDFVSRIRSILSTLPKGIGDYKAVQLTELEGRTDPRAKIDLLKSFEAELKAERQRWEDRRKEKEEERKRGEEKQQISQK